MQPNNNGFFGIKVSQPGVNVGQANANQLLYQNDYNTETFYDGGGNPRVLIGTLPDGSYGLWVSAPGVNATTANPSIYGQLVFNSNNNLFNIIASGTESVTVNSGNSGQTVTTTLAHGLGYAPTVMAFVTTAADIGPGGFSLTPYTYFEESSAIGPPSTLLQPIQEYYVSTDATNIYFNVLSGDCTFFLQLVGTFVFTYYVVQATAGTG